MDEFDVVGLRLDLVILPWVGFPLLVIGVVLVVLGNTKFAERGYSVKFAHLGFAMPGSFAAAIGGGAVLTWLALLIPFQPIYHHWYSTSGTVESVTNTFESGSGELSAGYVVELDSVERPLVFTDSRILSASGEVEVTCSVEWVPAGADRLNCWIAG